MNLLSRKLERPHQDLFELFERVPKAPEFEMKNLSYFKSKMAKPNQKIENDLQTNGIALDADWVRFLKQNNFHVGLSIDGPRELHDAYRKTNNGKPTFDFVMNAAKRLVDADVSFAALCVVNRRNALHPKEVYRFLADEVGTWRVQFNPAVEPRAFKQAAPAKMDFSGAPLQDSARAKPGHPLSIVTDWSDFAVPDGTAQ